MAREFTETEQAGNDRYFAQLYAAATVAGIEMVGDTVSALSIGPTHNRTVGGNYAARAGFPEEGIADEAFLRSISDTPPGVIRRGLYMAQHASGLLIVDTGYRVAGDTGNIDYDYRMRTLRPAEDTDHVISARAAGHLTLTDTGLYSVEHEYAERIVTPPEFFGQEFNLNQAEYMIRGAVLANQ